MEVKLSCKKCSVQFIAVCIKWTSWNKIYHISNQFPTTNFLVNNYVKNYVSLDVVLGVILTNHWIKSINPEFFVRLPIFFLHVC